VDQPNGQLRLSSQTFCQFLVAFSSDVVFYICCTLLTTAEFFANTFHLKLCGLPSAATTNGQVPLIREFHFVNLAFSCAGLASESLSSLAGNSKFTKDYQVVVIIILEKKY